MNVLSSRFTPVNDSDPICDHTWVTLCIYNIDPYLVTNKLGINPTGGKRKSANKSLPAHISKMSSVYSWTLSSNKQVSSKDIRRHLDWLLDKISPVIGQLKELQQIPEVEMAIRCSWFSAEEDYGSLTLWPEQMVKMAEANLEFNLSILFYDDE